MVYKAQLPKYIVYLIIAFLGFLGIVFLYLKGKLNLNASLVLGAVFVIWFIAMARIYIKKVAQKVILENGLLILKKSGDIKWQLSVTDIIIIDNEQGKFDAKIADTSRVLSYKSAINQIGFNLKTKDGKIYTVFEPIENYPSFLSNIKTSNPNIRTTKFTESLNQEYGEKVDKKINKSLF